MQRFPAPPRPAICGSKMSVLEKLPPELIGMVLELVGDPKSLHTFLFSRDLYPHVRRAIYLNLNFVAWDPASKATIETD